MKDWKAVGLKLLYPPAWLTGLLTILCASALVYIFSNDLDASPLAYAFYVLSFYTLTTVCAAGFKIAPAYYKISKEKMYANPYRSRYLTDIAYKTHVSLHRSLIINLTYVIVNVLSIFFYHSWWFVIFTVYYSLLALMRYLLFRFSDRVGIGKDRCSELKRARLCSFLLMTINLILSGAVLMIMYQDKGANYGNILIYVVALYTFYMTIHAIIGIVKYRKLQSPVMMMAKDISLASALFSMLSLETAMFSAFGGEMSIENQHIMIAATGAGVSIILITMSLYTVWTTGRELKQLRPSDTPTKQ